MFRIIELNFELSIGPTGIIYDCMIVKRVARVQIVARRPFEPPPQRVEL